MAADKSYRSDKSKPKGAKPTRQQTQAGEMAKLMNSKVAASKGSSSKGK